MLKILKSKWYPVDYERKLLYNDPHNREFDCSFGRNYRGMGTIGITGKRLLEYWNRYQAFTIVPALTEPSPAHLKSLEDSTHAN
jgi:hypothetical protein